MKKIFLLVTLGLFALNSFSQYNPDMWIVDNKTTKVDAVTGLIPANGFDTDPALGNVWTSEQYSYEWVGVNNDILKITFVNNQTPNYQPMGINLLQWVGNVTDSKFINDENGIPYSSHQTAVGTSVDFSMWENASISYKVIAEQEVFIRIDCQSVDAKVSNQNGIGLQIYGSSNIDLNDESKWQFVSYSWGGDAIADVYTDGMYDRYSPQWYGVDNPIVGTDYAALTDTAIVGLLFTLDDGNVATGTSVAPVTKVVYIKDIQIGNGTPVVYKPVHIFDYSLSADTIEIRGDTQISTITIETDSTWTVSSTDTWVTFTESSGDGNGVVELNTTINNVSTRTANILFTSGGVEKKVVLIQYSNLVELSSSDLNLTVGKDDGNTTSFDLNTTEVNWTAEVDVDWIHLSETSGMTNGTHSIIVEVSGNPESTERVGSIRIFAGGVSDVTILVTQDAGPGFISVSSVKFVSNYEKILIGEQRNLEITALPVIASNQNLIWESSDPTIATVDQLGNVTGLKKGGVNITATTQDGTNLIATLQVGVYETKPVMEISSVAGNMPKELVYYNTSGITELKVTGTINRNDISYISGVLIKLEKLDLSNATIEEYVESNGAVYAANTIPYQAFRYPPNNVLKEISLPNNLTKISESAFRDNANLTTVHFPESLDSIMSQAFSGCSSLDSVNLQSVAYIGNAAFGDCNLKQIYLRDLKSIEDYAFTNNTNLHSVYYDSESPVRLPTTNKVFNGIDISICDLFIPFNETLNFGAWTKFNLVEAKGVKLVNAEAIIYPYETTVLDKELSGTKGSYYDIGINTNDIYSISVNQSWITIIDSINGFTKNDFDYYRFKAEENTGIERKAVVTISFNEMPDTTFTITQLGVVEKFIDNTAGNLETSLLPTEINEITDITITGTIDARDFVTLKTMPRLSSVDISNATIVEYTGDQGTKESMYYKYEANQLPALAFKNLELLKNVELPISLTRINKQAFYECKTLQFIEIPNSVSVIETSAFSNCISINGNLNIPSTVDSICVSAFYGCSNIDSITFSNGLKYIGIAAFYGLWNITELNLPSSIDSIGENAFGSCNNLKYLDFKANVNVIPASCFSDCFKLETINITGSVKEIRTGAFATCYNLVNLSLPESIARIELAAFSSDIDTIDELTQGVLIIPKSVSFIGASAFYKNKFNEIIIGGTNLEIITSAFIGSKTVTKLHISNGVVKIQDYGFADLINLKDIYVESLQPIDLSSSPNTFDKIDYAACKLHVPYGTLALYQTADVWKKFSHIIEVKPMGISTTKLFIGSTAESSIDLHLTSQVDWSILENEDWLDVDIISGSTGEYNVNFKAKTETTTVRSAIITITCQNAPDFYVIVNQIPSLDIELTVSAGELQNSISDELRNTLTSVTLSGNIDVRDILFLRDSLPMLEVLNLTNATIVEYEGDVDADNLKLFEMFAANEIPRKAFKNKTTLKEIYLPSSITSIGEEAFYGCINLNVIGLTNMPSEVTVEESAFSGVNKTTCILEVPSGSKSSVSTLAVWKEFSIVEEVQISNQIKNIHTLINIYPVPVKDILHVSGVTNFEYSILNVLGHIVTQGIAQSTINVCDLQQGMYSLKIVKENNVEILQFVK